MVRCEWGVQLAAVLAMPFSSVTSVCDSPVVRDVMVKGTLARRSMLPSFALVKERSPRITCSLRETASQSWMCSAVPEALRPTTTGVSFSR